MKNLPLQLVFINVLSRNWSPTDNAAQLFDHLGTLYKLINKAQVEPQ